MVNTIHFHYQFLIVNNFFFFTRIHFIIHLKVTKFIKNPIDILGNRIIIILFVDFAAVFIHKLKLFLICENKF